MSKRDIPDDYFSRFNYENKGGTPILGINGTVILGHGISNHMAVKNMILLAREIHLAKLAGKIKHAISQVSVTEPGFYD
jgi:glycerol-3-phosphate acyltransferase PlsX